MFKVSIVMSYYNRREQFLRTLSTIQKTKYKNYEVIVVDDGSLDEHRLEDVEGINLIRIDPNTKDYINPCIPFNRAIAAATGDVVILQNPECLHLGDVVSHAANNVTDKNYISYECYSFDQFITERLPKKVDEIMMERIKGTLKQLPQVRPAAGDCGWYNHSTIKPTGYHFTSAISKRQLDTLGGFDEKFAHGVGFDDDEFLARVKHLGLEIVIPPIEPLVIHQWHYISGHLNEIAANDMSLFFKNQTLYKETLETLK
tara:strand:- start:1516 stop:2289 length:774 start_codon:yes stop_codon:yes gene_type:complete